MSTAVVFGGTGLVGNHLLKILINDDYYSKVKVFTRSKIEIIHHKLEIIETNFENIESLKDKISADNCFYCIGTTKKTTISRNFIFQALYIFKICFYNF